MSKATETNTTPTESAALLFGPRTTSFDRAWRRIESEACAGERPWTPKGAARVYVTAQRAAAVARTDASVEALGVLAEGRLERLAETQSRSVSDVAAKMAALVVEHGRTNSVVAGGVESAIHVGMCSCLADLVILGDRPLPDVSAVLDMREDDFELRDMTETEAAEGRTQPAPARDAFGAATIEGDALRAALGGWHQILWALREAAEKRALRPEGFDAVLTEIAAMSAELDRAESSGAPQ